MRFHRLVAVLAIAAAGTTTTTTPADAQSPPPHASTCTAEVTGVQVRHQDAYPAAHTLAVQHLAAVVICELIGVLTTAPINYLPLYQGGLSLHVRSSLGEDRRCGGSLLEYASVGPTLVIHGTATCVWEARDAVVAYRPLMHWSTMGLDRSNLTLWAKEGAFLN